MGLAIPDTNAGDRTFLWYESGKWSMPQTKLLRLLKNLPALAGEKVLLRIDGINEQTAHAISLLLKAKTFSGESMNEEDVVRSLYPPEGAVFKIIEMSPPGGIEALSNGIRSPSALDSTVN